ncbi:hypothetical protein C8F04DRAFT_59053 [Mycena alexandri]|uniref:Uncharacterized protein n=1 Tax=Mycena alexandri TaxID=1745969 RepID=A0AAD6XAR1_9AGAR|nr:hypothetical protein C8F04DRAFT_59053 [Mycena alexandri]
MPYWRSWQQICVELLAGNPSYEPNPSIECDTDPAVHRRLEYLRPILGHIHYGGARFQKASIEMAFESEGRVLSQALCELRANVRSPGGPSDTQVLRAMWRNRSELHYVANFREPLEIDVGDIGYIVGEPPRFVRLANVRPRITDGWAFEPLIVQPLKCFPPDKWTQTTVQGIIRHKFLFPSSGPVDLADWRAGRPRLDKDFLLRRINLPRESGLVVDCSEAWNVLAESATTIASNHSECPVSASDLILSLSILIPPSNSF